MYFFSLVNGFFFDGQHSWWMIDDRENEQVLGAEQNASPGVATSKKKNADQNWLIKPEKTFCSNHVPPDFMRFWWNTTLFCYILQLWPFASN